VLRFLLKRAWIGILLGVALVLLPNVFIRSFVPVAGGLPTPTAEPTHDARDDAFAEGLRLAATDPVAALPFLQQVMFSDHPQAEAARTLAQNIQAGRVAENEAYLFTASGQALAAIGEWTLARDALLQAVQLDPDYAEAWAYLGEAQYQNGQDPLPALQRAIELNPNSLAAQLFNALHWQRAEDYEQADLHFYIASQLELDNPSIYIQWGQNDILAGNPVEARARYETAASLTPEDPQVWKALARYSVDSELFVAELGLPAALQVVLEDPVDVQALVLLGRAHLLLGNGQSGIGFLERALEVNPDSAEAHLFLGIYLLDEGQTEAALLHLNAVIASAPGTSEARLASELIVQNSH
jgi:tetratricopeptide (TPR) repeat protein